MSFLRSSQTLAAVRSPIAVGAATTPRNPSASVARSRRCAGSPHVHVDVKHQGATWEAVLAPPSRMEARGLKPDMTRLEVLAESGGDVCLTHRARCECSGSFSILMEHLPNQPARAMRP